MRARGRKSATRLAAAVVRLYCFCRIDVIYGAFVSIVSVAVVDGRFAIRKYLWSNGLELQTLSNGCWRLRVENDSSWRVSKK